MAKRKRRAEANREAVTSDQKSRLGQRSPRFVRWLLYATLVVLSAVLVYVYTRPKGLQSVVPEAAASAPPEVAVQLLELDDVVSRLVETYPDDPAALDVMGWLHYKIGKVEHAGIYWEQCLQIDPNFAPAHHALGIMSLELGEYEDAEKHFRRNVELDPTSSAFKVELSQALVECGKSEEAIEVLLDDLLRQPEGCGHGGHAGTCLPAVARI